MYGNENYNAPSRFIREIPKEYLQEVRLNTMITRPSSYAPSYAQDDALAIGLTLGQPVFHEIFGEGTVLNVEGQGANARIQVNFDTEGSKWLVMQYANLQAL